MNIIVFSANIDNYDIQKDINVYDKNVRYILFTDNKLIKSKVWEVHNINFLKKDLDGRRKSRFIKINSHLVLPHHDISIWIDSCYTPIIGNFNLFLEKIKFYNKTIMCYRHDVRSCIYDEAIVVKDKNLDYKDLVDKQINKYRMIGFPSKIGLFDTGFFIRKNCESANKFNNFWWEEVNNGSSRDQLSQVFSAWKANVKIDPISIGSNIYNNEFLMKKNPHSKILKYK